MVSPGQESKASPSSSYSNLHHPNAKTSPSSAGSYHATSSAGAGDNYSVHGGAPSSAVSTPSTSFPGSPSVPRGGGGGGGGVAAATSSALLATKSLLLGSTRGKGGKSSGRVPSHSETNATDGDRGRFAGRDGYSAGGGWGQRAVGVGWGLPGESFGGGWGPSPSTATAAGGDDRHNDDDHVRGGISFDDMFHDDDADAGRVRHDGVSNSSSGGGVDIDKAGEARSPVRGPDSGGGNAGSRREAGGGLKRRAHVRQISDPPRMQGGGRYGDEGRATGGGGRGAGAAALRGRRASVPWRRGAEGKLRSVFLSSVLPCFSRPFFALLRRLLGDFPLLRHEVSCRVLCLLWRNPENVFKAFASRWDEPKWS